MVQPSFFVYLFIDSAINDSLDHVNHRKSLDNFLLESLNMRS